jgi:hypothetical protein
MTLLLCESGFDLSCYIAYDVGLTLVRSAVREVQASELLLV